MNEQIHRWVGGRLDKLQGNVLEVGGYDVNGSLRDIVPHAIVTDMREGPNVDIVCSAEDLLKVFEKETFDAVVSTEALEHMEHWQDALVAMWGVLKQNGWLLITMASVNKRYHGYPGDYVRLKEEHVREIWPGADVKQVGPVSIGWCVQKTHDIDPWKISPLVPSR